MNQKTTIQIFCQINPSEDPEKVKSAINNIFPEIEKIVCRLMEKKPEMRFEDCQELLDDLDFDGLNPDGAYKSNRFRPLHLCLPDPDDIGTTHSAVANEVKKLLVNYF